MSVLRPVDLTDPDAARPWSALVREAARADAAEPFSDQARLDAASGRRQAFAVLAEAPGAPGRALGPVAGALILGAGEIDAVIAPTRRGNGVGGRAVNAALALADRDAPSGGRAPLTAWSHGDHPAARALAARFGFAAVRRLLRLRRPLTAEDARPTHPAADSIRIATFRPGADDAEWVGLNARIFTAHPEQGAITKADLRDRRAGAWFDADDFVIARDASGRMVGYNWLKIEPGQTEGEIYVIGVAPEAAGRGLGRRLMRAGLARLAQRGCADATLYVEGDNAPALGLYRSLGFEDDLVDVQYARGVDAARR